jgi:alpha-mannosidase
MLHEMRWTSEKIGQRLRFIESQVARRRHPLPLFRYLQLDGPSADPLAATDVDDANWPSINWGTYWGEPGTDFVLRTEFQVPADWEPDAPVALYLPIGEAGDFSHPEALAYIDGQPHASCDRHHQEILLGPHWSDGASHILALHGWTGGTPTERLHASGDAPPAPPSGLFMGRCEVIQIHLPTRDFVALARVALGVADHLPEYQPARAHLYNALDEAFKNLDMREPLGDRFYTSVPVALSTLQDGVSRSGTSLDVDITAVGHAHIDVAWLWPLDQTRRKAGRTFYNVLRLMEQFPEFHFTQSQPQLYDFVRQDYPDLFAAIQQRVAEGRWEPVGGMWVEADCNLCSGESLARQFLLGRTFFRRGFGAGAESPVLWLPDVFGYAWNLPQLVREAGLDYFFTIKIGWNQYNRLPFDSFWWQGLDGTRILTHFSPTKCSGSAHVSTYNATAEPDQVLSTWTNFQQKDWGKPGAAPPLLMSYGYGDGGGGPTREMVENIREMGDFPATPRVHCGTVGDFFRQLEATVGDRLPTWNGELYLEYHRGTYTTQARTKRANRKSEFLLHDAEFLAAWASLAAYYDYPHAELNRAWELLCLNQFHDILPGSSIGQVYEDSARDHAAIRIIGEEVRETALAALARLLPDETAFVAANPTSFGGRRIGLLPEQWIEGQTLSDLTSGELLVAQPVEAGTLVEIPHVPPYGLVALAARSTSPPPPRGMLTVHQTGAAVVLENDMLRVEFDEAGEIGRLFDKAAGREVLPAGQRANVFQAFEDRPLSGDAWDIDIFFDDKQWAAEPAHSLIIVEMGPLRAGVEIRRRLLSSEIVQRVYLYQGSRRLDFDTLVDWRERHVLLKVAFPVEVLSPTATYDIQFGNVQRSTHRNTSWDWARFETCAHKWVDLSEGDYGVSLLNDCKYGHDLQGNVLRLTLLRGPTYPDPDADQGEHRFTYSLLPHPGDWRGGTVPAAYALNDPLIVRRVDGGASGRGLAPSLVSVDAPNVIIETVKLAEDGQGLIVRLYENERCRGPVTLRSGIPLAGAHLCNLLEEARTSPSQEHRAPLIVGEDTVRLVVKPYQIVTLRLVPASEEGRG